MIMVCLVGFDAGVFVLVICWWWFALASVCCFTAFDWLFGSGGLLIVLGGFCLIVIWAVDGFYLVGLWVCLGVWVYVGCVASWHVLLCGFGVVFPTDVGSLVVCAFVCCFFVSLGGEACCWGCFEFGCVFVWLIVDGLDCLFWLFARCIGFSCCRLLYGTLGREFLI